MLHTDIIDHIQGQVRLKKLSGPSAAARTGQGAERCGQNRLGGRAPRLGQARGPLAAAICTTYSCKTTCQQVRSVVQRMQRRSEVQNSGYAQVEKYTIHSSFNSLDSYKTIYCVPFLRHLLENVISGNLESRVCFELRIYTQNGIVMKAGFVSKTRQ